MERIIHEEVRVTDKKSPSFGELGIILEEFHGCYVVEIYKKNYEVILEREQFVLTREEEE